MHGVPFAGDAPALLEAQAAQVEGRLRTATA
jgi:hypothetical protein